VPRTPKGTTRVIVNRLLELGWTKWRLAFKVKWSEKTDGLGGTTDHQTWQTIDAWAKGRWEANRHNTEILKELLYEECRKQNKWFFDENIPLDSKRN
jgi:hypothetical protein